MSDAIKQAIEALDDERSRATVAKDAATLNRVLADDLLYVHGNATGENKSLYIERVTGGFYDYKALTSQRRNYRVYGDVVLVDGDVRIQVVTNGTPKDFVSRYLQAWVQRDGAWQMVSWQSTPVPAAA